MERVHFHVLVGVKNLTKYFFATYCADMLHAATVFAISIITSCVFLQRSEILYWENKSDKRENSNNKIKLLFGLVKERAAVTLL